MGEKVSPLRRKMGDVKIWVQRTAGGTFVRTLTQHNNPPAEKIPVEMEASLLEMNVMEKKEVMGMIVQRIR